MNKVAVKVLKVNENAALPKYESEGAAGMDLKAFLKGDITIPPLGREKIPTGLRMEIPQGFEAQIRPRSGLALKWGLTVLNSPGTIDSDYRGEIQVILINLGQDSVVIKNGDRIAQLVVSPVCHALLVEVQTLEESTRGGGGFGSTG